MSDNLMQNFIGKLIVAGEQAGQSVAVEKQLFPFQFQQKSERVIWEKLGFVFTGEKYNKVLQYTVFPDGWTLQSGGSHFRNNIIDNYGRRRGEYFYKASSYDLRAFVYPLLCRYVLLWEWDANTIWYYVLDQGVSPDQQLFQTEIITLLEVRTPEDYEENQLKQQELRQQAKDWLDRNFPDYENPLAYWDDNQN